MNLEALATWWSTRTSRERLLLHVLGALFVVALPLLAFQGAAGYRAEGEASLRAAQDVANGVEALRKAGPAPAGVSGEAGLRSFAVSSAQALGLKASRVEPAGADRLRISFEPADSRAVYRWMDGMGKQGAFIVRTSIVRDGDKDLVLSQFEVGSSPQ